MEKKSPDLSVITVTYNERENIRLFITTLNRIMNVAKIKGEIIVVDDSSPDGTSDVVLEMKKLFPNTILVKRPGKMGIGSAYLRGFQEARGTIAAFLDADLSHAPEVLSELYDLAAPGNVVFGSRYLGNTKFERDFAHRMGTYVLNRWTRFWLKTGMNDHTNGYVVVQKERLDKILAYGQLKTLRPFDHILYGITIAAIARKLSFPCVERKATYNKRQHGETKIPFLWGLRVVFGDMAYVLKVKSKLQ